MHMTIDLICVVFQVPAVSSINITLLTHSRISAIPSPVVLPSILDLHFCAQTKAPVMQKVLLSPVHILTPVARLFGL